MNTPHTLAIQPRWNDFDMLGHINNTIYFQYFDLAKSDFFLSRLGNTIDLRHIAPVAVNVNCNFSAPILPGEPVEVSTRVAKIGEKSLTFEQQITNPDTGAVKCACTTVMVAFDLRAGTSVTVPEEWHTLL